MQLDIYVRLSDIDTPYVNLSVTAFLVSQNLCLCLISIFKVSKSVNEFDHLCINQKILFHDSCQLQSNYLAPIERVNVFLFIAFACISHLCAVW